MNRYVWTLERGHHTIDSGIHGLVELISILEDKSLHGTVPVRWIVETMQDEESKDGRSLHHHDVPPPDNWKLSWARLGVMRGS